MYYVGAGMGVGEERLGLWLHGWCVCVWMWERCVFQETSLFECFGIILRLHAASAIVDFHSDHCVSRGGVGAVYGCGCW